MRDPRFPPHAFERLDDTPDADFYAMPRFVTHIDDAAIGAVTALYRERLPAGGRILDLMSSWVSHLPPDVAYGRVAGLGMNADELVANPRLADWTVQDLNAEPRLPYAAGEFDACTVCVSIDYLVQPVEVLADVGRVLVPGAPVVITFSNRCFPTKAVRLWHTLDDSGRMRLVGRYLELAGCWDAIEELDRSPARGASDPLLAVIGRRGA